MNTIRIVENPPHLQVAYLWPNPPCRRAKELRSAKFERRQRELDSDKRKWFNSMVWGMQTVDRKK